MQKSMMNPVSVLKWLALITLVPVSLSAQASQTILSLDLCTDWMLLKYASPSHKIIYSPLLYQSPPHWVPDQKKVHDGSLENILQIDPDLILSGEFNALTLRKRLKQLGQNIISLTMPESVEGIKTYSDQFASFVNVNPSLHQDLKLKNYPPQNKHMLLVGSNGIGTGRATLEHDILKKAGYNNYLNHDGFSALNLEQLMNYPPDIMLETSQYSDTPSLANLFSNHKALSRIPRGKIDKIQTWRWQCPGPWTLDLVDELARQGHQ